MDKKTYKHPLLGIKMTPVLSSYHTKNTIGHSTIVNGTTTAATNATSNANSHHQNYLEKIRILQQTQQQQLQQQQQHHTIRSNNIGNTPTTTNKTHTSLIHNGINNTNNNNNNSFNASTALTAKTAACIAGTRTPTPMEQLQAVHAKATTIRTKNEEAIHDLRTRIPEIENIFDVHCRIGNGTFSTVLLATLKKEHDLPENNRRKFAIKHHIPTSHPDRIMKELKCMAMIGGTQNVVGINCCLRYNESVAFVMPYLAHDRFHDFFQKMEVSEVQFYMKNLLIALAHVHRYDVIHRDVKPSNFLYNRRKRQFLLVDFGLAQEVPNLQNHQNVTKSIFNTNSKIASLEEAAATINNNNNIEQSGLKRGREADGGVPANDTAKRLRVNGCEGVSGTTAVAAAAADVSGSSFKMPLKQINEIQKNRNGTNDIATPLSRQVKSAALGISLSQRLQQKTLTNTPQQQQQQQETDAVNAARAAGGACTGQQQPTVNSNAAVPPAAVNGTTVATTAAATNDNNNTPKYVTNRNIIASQNAKCNCYGNPQVCNMCLVKKEVHASRAGTPGYRPPEVLLKYADQTTAVDIWAAGVIFLSILSSVYPFFKAPNDYVALAEMVTIFGDKTIRKTAFVLDRLVTLSQKSRPLDLRKLCVRFRNRSKFSSPELLKKYQRADGTCEVCKNCDQYYFNCLCAESTYKTEPFEADDIFPASAYDLLTKLLEVNPHKRITAEEALKHPFMTETYYSRPSLSANSVLVKRERY